MPAVNTGAAGHDTLAAASWARDVDPYTTNLVGEAGKLTKLVDMMKGGRKPKSTTAEWIVHDEIDAFTAISAAPSNGLTDLTFTVTEPDFVGVGDVVMHEDGETSRVASKTSTTITLEARSRGALPASTWADGDTLYNIGNASSDGSTIAAADHSVEVFYENYQQLFWKRIEVDGTTMRENAAKGIHGGDYIARLRKLKYNEVMRSADYALIFGEAAKTTDPTTGKPVRTMGGIREHIHSDNVDTTATLNQAALEAHAATKGLLEGDDSRVMVCSNTGAVGINGYALSQIDYAPGGSEVGYRVKRYTLPMGDLVVCPHYNLSKGGDFNGLFLFLNVESIERRAMLPLKLHGDINTGLVDVRTDAYMGQWSYVYGHPKHHSEINGVTAYA